MSTPALDNFCVDILLNKRKKLPKENSEMQQEMKNTPSGKSIGICNSPLMVEDHAV